VTDPGMDDHDPTDAELDAEDQARSTKTVRGLLEDDLADPVTPSRRFELEPEAGGEHLEGFDVDLREWRSPDGR
jgi:hypothetical protein